MKKCRNKIEKTYLKKPLQVFPSFTDKSIFESACVSSKILYVYRYLSLDRSALTNHNLELAPVLASAQPPVAHL